MTLLLLLRTPEAADEPAALPDDVLGLDDMARTFRASELAAMQVETDDLLPDECVIERASFTSDSMGGSVPAWAALGTALCRLAPVDPSERQGEDTARSVDDWLIVVPSATVVSRADRLTMGGTAFYVVGKRTHGSWTLNQVLEVSTVAP